MSRRNDGGPTAHSKAVQALTDARQHTRKYRYEMEKSERVREDAVFVRSDDPHHPQKLAHAALIDYHEEVNQPEYTIKVDDMWQETLTNEAGNEITIEVPKHDVVEKTVTEETFGDYTPDMSKLETREETLSLEMLGHRWSGRSVTVEVTVDSPYRKEDKQVETIRLWLPPKAIKAAYSQLNGCLSKIGLLAQTTAPIEHDPDPV